MEAGLVQVQSQTACPCWHPVLVLLHLLLLAAAAALQIHLDIQANALHNNRPLGRFTDYQYAVLVLVAEEGSHRDDQSVQTMHGHS